MVSSQRHVVNTEATHPLLISDAFVAKILQRLSEFPHTCHEESEL